VILKNEEAVFGEEFPNFGVEQLIEIAKLLLVMCTNLLYRDRGLGMAYFFQKPKHPLP
jgi:hypothetical protein